MDVTELLELAKSAADDHIKYACFIKESEVLQGSASIFANEEKQAEYQTCWFELEIVNALALDGWESEGKPTNWLDTWNERYKDDAKELIAKLCSLLSQSTQ